MGAGQLGRMTALAAARLGYRCHVFSPERHSPAAQVAEAAVVADYDDEAALARFAESVDVVTFEFENVPHRSVKLLSDLVPTRPRWECLRISQDRLDEKDFVNAAGVATALYRRVDDADELARAAESLGRPCVLKTRRLGYDGKGQVLIEDGADPEACWAKMGADAGAEAGIVEKFVPFEREISVIVARAADGTTAAYDPVENRHVAHVLDTTTAPARIDDARRLQALAIAKRLVAAMDLVGLLAIEMFVTHDGRILVNEVAPRPHNSGHWTVDACATSQFEQLVRAVCDLPLGSTERNFDAVMRNLLGSAAGDWHAILAEPGARLHLYGKDEARPGRKMGHVTRLYGKGSLGAAARPAGADTQT
jgi:5-(carboxyamino)imidazole ribonucleotide synthase